MSYVFKVAQPNGEELPITVEAGVPLFVLGANGSGKSSLMTKFYQQNPQEARRILAHRRTWFSESATNLTAHAKKQTVGYIKSNDSTWSSRWTDTYADKRSSISIFDLVILGAVILCEKWGSTDLGGVKPSNPCTSP